MIITALSSLATFRMSWPMMSQISSLNAVATEKRERQSAESVLSYFSPTISNFVPVEIAV
ncbi:hypothetical protein GCM10007338_08650 [Corynebacterium pelargi]|uniref:Uncharacterized protein n=1 Tax=Corynebacterium pelargi TaxID=1471400 RepID=A0A410WBE5_9CORY|nr:hypothetical protein CPELA_10105 [Corynebacterium pelargi]GGG73644.1 hypothetical protein GCM10007338_08650 [Corynebacterium pelargi]